MEQLRPDPPLDGQVSPALSLGRCTRLLQGWKFLWLAGIFLSARGTAWAHASDLILAKCSAPSPGLIELVLSVDYGQHPVLTDSSGAFAALREALLVESPAGTWVALDTLATGVPSLASVPDPELPVSQETPAADHPCQWAVLRYAWAAAGAPLRFSVKQSNRWDVLFWLGAGVRPPVGPVPWQILIAGDRTPAIPLPLLPGRDGQGWWARLSVAAAILIGLGAWVTVERHRLNPKPDDREKRPTGRLEEGAGL